VDIEELKKRRCKVYKLALVTTSPEEVQITTIKGQSSGWSFLLPETQPLVQDIVCSQDGRNYSRLALEQQMRHISYGWSNLQSGTHLFARTMESPRLILPDLSTKQHIDTDSSRAARQSSEIKLCTQPGRRSPTDDHLKSGAVTERSTRTAHVSGSHTFSPSSINHFDEVSSSQVHKSGALTDRGTRTDHQRNALKSSGSWRPRRESRGPLVQFLLRSAWGIAAVDGTPRRELEDILKETCGEDPQTSARSAEAESLEVALDALQKSYNNVKVGFWVESTTTTNAYPV
jgi:hypothetical protein